MKSSQVSSVPSRVFINQFKISKDGPIYTGPGKFDPTFRQVFPDGFGRINQGTDIVTWAEVRTIIRPPNRYEVIYCGLRYDIHNEPLSLNRYQTELHMLTHSYDGVLQEKLMLIYQYPAGRWDKAELVRCGIAQPTYIKNKSGCLLLQSLKDPLQCYEQDFFFRKNQHRLISFNDELYFANSRFKTLKKLMRHDDTAPAYDALLKAFELFKTKKPSKTEVNQGYFNAFDASLSMCSEISKLTGCSLEEGALEDGEGLIFVADINDTNNYHLMMGYLEFSTNPQSFPANDYTIFKLNQTESSFYKGKGIIVADHQILAHGLGTFCQKQTSPTNRTTLWHQGEFAINNRSGAGSELIYEVDIVNDSSSSLREVRRSSLKRGLWKLDQKEGLFSYTESDKTALGIIYVANQRRPVPFVSKQGDLVSIVGYAEGATAEQISYYVTLSPTASPRFVKVIDVSRQLHEDMSFSSFFEAINTCPYNDVFASLLLKHASFSDLCFFQSESRAVGYFELANQFFSLLCGPFALPDDPHLFLFETGDITSQALLSYLDVAISYLASFDDNSNLHNGAVILKWFFTDANVQDYSNALKYFPELSEPWTLIQSENKSMSNNDKREAFNLLLQSAFPWVFRRVYMIFSSVMQYKSSQLTTLTQEEQSVSEMFDAIRRDSMMAKLKRSCEVLCDQENTYREGIITAERQLFNYFIDEAPLSIAYIKARELLYNRLWDELFEQLKKQESHFRVELQNEQKLVHTAIKPAHKLLHALQEFYGEELRKRQALIAAEASDWSSVLQDRISSFSQIEQQFLVDESLNRNQILEGYRLSFDTVLQESSNQNARLSFFNNESKCRNALLSDEKTLFNQLNIQMQLDYVVQYVSNIPFDRPFDVYVVGSAVLNKVLGQDWRENQDIDIMVVARSQGEFLQISEENAYCHGLRVSPHIFGLYTGFVHISGAGRRRIDIKVSDYSPLLDFNRRDFTVGALYQASNGETLDPSQRGLFDLRSKQLNTVMPAAESFYQSPVQMLRAIKYFMNGYTLSKDIVDAMKNWSTNLTVYQWSHICAVVRTHLGTFDNQIYTRALMTHGLTKTLFRLPQGLSVVDTLRGINYYVFPQLCYSFFPQVVEAPVVPIPQPSFFQRK